MLPCLFGVFFFKKKKNLKNSLCSDCRRGLEWEGRRKDGREREGGKEESETHNCNPRPTFRKCDPQTEDEDGVRCVLWCVLAKRRVGSCSVLFRNAGRILRARREMVLVVV